MEVLFIVLNELDYLDDILQELIRHKIKGATVLDSQGLAQTLIKDGIGDIFKIGIYAGNLEESNPHNKTIMSVMKKEKVAEVVASIREILADIPHVGAGFMFTMPVANIYLLHEKENDHDK